MPRRASKHDWAWLTLAKRVGAPGQADVTLVPGEVPSVDYLRIEITEPGTGKGTGEVYTIDGGRLLRSLARCILARTQPRERKPAPRKGRR